MRRHRHRNHEPYVRAHKHGGRFHTRKRNRHREKTPPQPPQPPPLHPQTQVAVPPPPPLRQAHHSVTVCLSNENHHSRRVEAAIMPGMAKQRAPNDNQPQHTRTHAHKPTATGTQKPPKRHQNEIEPKSPAQMKSNKQKSPKTKRKK